eukprot:m.44985 g.44985  ORF g.44985 m.44985 type:complete len:321 (-) comp10646_c0_seq1:118-1080(-)
MWKKKKKKKEEGGGEEQKEAKKDEEKESEKKQKKEEEQPKKKKKIHKKKLTVVRHKDCLLADSMLTDLIEAEAKFSLGDRREREKNDARNALEEYIYEMRDKLCSVYQEFTKEQDNDAFRQQLTGMEDWLYGDGEDESKQVYVEKLKDLHVTGDDIVSRKNEFETRPQAIESLQQTIVHFRKLINEHANGDEKYDHIPAEDVKKVEDIVSKKEKWLASKVAEQQALSKADDPAVKTSEIKSAEREIRSIGNSVANKPKPTVEPPKEDENEKKEEDGEKETKGEGEGEGDKDEEKKEEDNAEQPTTEEEGNKMDEEADATQ